MDPNDPILISKVREMFLSEYESNSNKYDECDAKSVREIDFTVNRFLMMTNSNVENAFVMLRDCMLWRKSYGVNSRTDLDFPKIFYKTGAFFRYENDKEGNAMLYIRAKLYRKFPKFSEYLKQYMIHLINKVDTDANGKGWSIVFDCTGFGPSNWDLSMIRFLVSSLKYYFPRGVSYTVLFGLPRLMSAFAWIGLKLIPDEAKNRVKFVSKDDIFNYIDKENLPDFMGGLCQVNYRAIPEGVRDNKDIGVERGYTIEEIESVENYYAEYLNDSNNNSFDKITQSY